MKEEIGGYLELEQFAGAEYYPELLKLNLGRTALLYLLKAVDAHTLWVPYYLCESVTDTCKKAGYKLKYYRVDENLEPIMGESVKMGEYLLLVNYYGQFTEERIRKIRKKYTFVIVDNTHAFFQKPVEGIPTLYSLRKFFGLCDGAYASLGYSRSPIDIELLEKDISGGRMEHVLGRFEHPASDYYQKMLDNAHSLEEESVKQMSALTANLLKAIPYEQVKGKRAENYRCLEALLGDVNRRNWTMPEGPFAYPFYCKNGIAMRKALAQKKIYVQTFWQNVIAKNDTSTREYDYAANILPLPCDQRYGEEEMKAVAAAVRECIIDVSH